MILCSKAYTWYGITTNVIGSVTSSPSSFLTSVLEPLVICELSWRSRADRLHLVHRSTGLSTYPCRSSLTRLGHPLQAARTVCMFNSCVLRVLVVPRATDSLKDVRSTYEREELPMTGRYSELVTTHVDAESLRSQYSFQKSIPQVNLIRMLDFTNAV